MKPQKKQRSHLGPSKNLGLLFADRRKQADLPVKTIAAYLGVPEETIRLYESGQHIIPLYHVYALSNCLNVAPNEIIKLEKEL